MDKQHLFCTKCGAENMIGSRFCAMCGSPVRVTADSSSQTSATHTMVQPEREAPSGSDFISLTCPTCGGKLSVTSGMERFACGYCGSEHIVRRSGNTVSLEPVMNKLNQISEHVSMMGGGIDKMTAIAEKQVAEVAIKRLSSEIEDISKRRAALDNNATTSWMIFGISAVVLGFSLLVLHLDDGETGILSMIFVPCAFLGGLMTFLGIIGVFAMLKNNKKKAKEYDGELSQKMAQIRHNRDIVER